MLPRKVVDVLENIWGQVGWGFEYPDLLEDVAALCRKVGLDDLWGSFLTQTNLWLIFEGPWEEEIHWTALFLACAEHQLWSCLYNKVIFSVLPKFIFETKNKCYVWNSAVIRLSEKLCQYVSILKNEGEGNQYIQTSGMYLQLCLLWNFAVIKAKFIF